MRIVTVGGYGFSESLFIQKLKASEVDTFVDVRQRRSVRGSQFAYLNSNRLQSLLSELQIRYVYERDLAPTHEVRRIQREIDNTNGVAKRERGCLSPEFIEAYRQNVLAHLSCDKVASSIGRQAQVVALFCVETHPISCHRSLAAAWLADYLQVSVCHLLP
jgi:uncharacterized protein (DUF488 family)